MQTASFKHIQTSIHQKIANKLNVSKTIVQKSALAIGVCTTVYLLSACTNQASIPINTQASTQKNNALSNQINEQANNGTAQPPNIIVILADDIGVGDISFYNKVIEANKVVVETDNIDQLAEKGVWFSDAHSATALCAPTRYAVMTGKNNYRSYAPWGVWGSFKENAIKQGEPTLANVVKPQGYQTAFIGKWHLGGDFLTKSGDKIYRGTDEGALPNVDLETMVGGGPNDLGFDYSFMLPDGIQGPLYLAYENQQWYPLADNSKKIHITEHTAQEAKIVSDKGDGMGDSQWRTQDIGNLLSRKAASFISGASKRDKRKPFMLYYASPMAHIPHMPPNQFDGKKVKGITPSLHLDMVYELDLQVGRIVDELKAHDLLDNTLIIFTSDNGGLRYRAEGTYEAGHRVSGKYRGSKNTPYEGGHRVPFIVHWPKHIERNISDAPILVQDILATIAEAAGRTLSVADAPDSKSLLPLVKGQRYQERQTMLLQAGSTNTIMYRENEWKLIIKSNHKVTKFEPVALFNLQENIEENESQNLINEKRFAEKIKTMLDNYLALRKSGEATREL